MIQPLLSALGDEKAEVRREAVLSLGRVGTGSREVSEAVRLRMGETDPLMTANVEIALAMLGEFDDSTPAHLVKALGSEHLSTSSAARSALLRLARESPDRIVAVLKEALASDEERVLENALTVLQGMRGKGSLLLPHVAGLFGKVAPKTRRRLVRTVADIDPRGDHALPFCAKALDDPDAFVRKEALMSVLRYRNRLDSVSDRLIESLKDPNEENRLLSIGIVKGLSDKAGDAIPSLISLSEEGSPRVRAAAIAALGSIKPISEDVFPAFGKALNDKDAKIRAAAINALRMSGTREPQPAINELEKALSNEPEKRTREQIIAALDELKKPHKGNASTGKEKRGGG